MNISLLPAGLGTQSRPMGNAGASDAGAPPGRGFAEAMAALDSTPGEPTPPLAEPPSPPAGQASLQSVMLALGGSPDDETSTAVPLEEGPLAGIAKRLALMSSAGEPIPAERSPLAAEDLDREAPPPEPSLAPMEIKELATRASGQPGAAGMTPGRSQREPAAGLMAHADLREAAVAQQGSREPWVLSARSEGLSAQRPLPQAEGFPHPLGRGAAAPGPSTTSAEWRTDGLASLQTVSPSAAAPGTAPASPVQGALQAPVASQAWSTQLGQQLVMLGQRGGEQRVELRLNPAELGPLTISLKVSEQGAQAQFLSAHAPVRQAVEQAIPQLREALAEQGISLGDTSVGEHRQQGREQGQAFAGSAPSGVATSESVEIESLIPAPASTGQLIEAGRVDLYA